MKYCEYCSQSFERTYEAKTEWENRRFCSTACRNRWIAQRNFKTGRWVDREGYIIVQNQAETGGKKVREHRLVMERHLGRKLLPDEVVHHINHKRDDNRLENLELIVGSGNHKRIHHHEVSEETRQKLSIASKGKPKSAEHRRKLVEALTRMREKRKRLLPAR